MCDELHLVTEQEIPQLLAWLEQDLPRSFLLYGVVRVHIRTKWPGFQFYTIGWPNIQAAATGHVDVNCGCVEYFNTTPKHVIYARDVSSAQALLTVPGIFDWNKQAQIRYPADLASGIHQLFQNKISRLPMEQTFCTMMSQGDDVTESSPVPDDLIISPLDPKRHAKIVNSTWAYKMDNSELYIEQMIQQFPSCGVFDKSGQCLGHVIGTDSGTFGILYVVPEMRRHGLGQMLLRGISKAYFDLDLPCAAYCHVDNAQAIQLFEKTGFKKSTAINMMYYRPS
ncbi:glycine N-phenylacetyltransferase-like [Physella acuta]|uniref:glycine N-phenylacetyltransferase-like n=1 Tax=Physella acuta TaxID=109671 RepID=UPI0027DD9CD4|nr:glycine N-phenylacetyltransferase-like [Physella acuta]